MYNKKETIDKYFYKKIGQIIQEQRCKKGYSLRQLRDMTGISYTTLDNYELGKHRIDPVRWSKICEALQLSEKIFVKVALGLGDYE